LQNGQGYGKLYAKSLKVLKTLKTVWMFGRFLYELVDEIRHEDRKQKAYARKMMSERYREASNTVSKESR